MATTVDYTCEWSLTMVVCLQFSLFLDCLGFQSTPASSLLPCIIGRPSQSTTFHSIPIILACLSISKLPRKTLSSRMRSEHWMHAQLIMPTVNASRVYFSSRSPHQSSPLFIFNNNSFLTGSRMCMFITSTFSEVNLSTHSIASPFSSLLSIAVPRFTVQCCYISTTTLPKYSKYYFY